MISADAGSAFQATVGEPKMVEVDPDVGMRRSRGHEARSGRHDHRGSASDEPRGEEVAP